MLTFCHQIHAKATYREDPHRWMYWRLAWSNYPCPNIKRLNIVFC